jgi:pimeloyl-ACP methyl ester carboxylesterase
VLALHGLTSTTKVWSGLAAALRQARIVAPDLVGRGSAAERRTAPGLSGHADDVVRLADELGLDGGVAPERSILVSRPVVRALFWTQMRGATTAPDD